MARKANKAAVDSTWGKITIDLTNYERLPSGVLVEIAHWLNDPMRGGLWFTEVSSDASSMVVYFSDPNIAMEMRLRWT